jgi:CTP:molybdopterin cytidylyltransferase MocA
MINAVVLAAGESKRMGKPKPLLRFGDRTFLGQIIAVLKLSDVDRTTIVLGAEAEAIRKSVDLSGTEVVINKNYQKGQLSSLIAAIETTPPKTQAILLCLADMPFITVEVVNEIVAKFKETSAAILVPVFDGQRGHPTLFARAVFGELLNAPPEQGARYVLYSNEQRILELQTSDSGILIRIDTPDDYRLHFGAEPTLAGNSLT